MGSLNNLSNLNDCARQNSSSSNLSPSTTSSTSQSRVSQQQQLTGQNTQQSTSTTVSPSIRNNYDPFSQGQSKPQNPFYEQTTELLQGVADTYVISDTSPLNVRLIHSPNYTNNKNNLEAFK
ncbi:7067_t:CDS:1 [Ambispora gerdemannii]|uniref:7067_t:CDS:1 n=1 Tax=Ambispora gerdemannii TaxID=144530 RepID=A0A9N8ZGF3_9GLOM|nr:7067_t:CDS:1 [Ambispora gerdemannii]